MKHHIRILFICKERPAHYGASYGLYNSCLFLCNALKKLNVECKLVVVVDNNCIDREVHLYRPTHVFIEALWVVPEKFEVLIPLHPHVKWYVRLHSNTPFLAGESVAIDWLEKYNKLHRKYPQLHIASNALKLIGDLRRSLHIHAVYAPNIYCPEPSIIPEGCFKHHDSIIKIGCFGSLRPLKNQLIQTQAAIAFANELRKKMEFHINYSSIEMNGQAIYRNIQSLFHHSHHKLIKHDWYLHDEFLRLVKSMDLGLQVSFSETFNIVAADFVYVDVPVVGSKEIEWMNRLYKADPTSLDDITFHMWLAWTGKNIDLHHLNKWGLNAHNCRALLAWHKLLFPSHDESCLCRI